jgi:hypothetical protein
MDSQMLWLIIPEVDRMFRALVEGGILLAVCGVGLFLVLIPLVVIWARGDKSVQELSESLRKN